MRLEKQRGAALLIVLMVVALVAILATEMGARLQLQVQRASNIKSSNKSIWQTARRRNSNFKSRFQN